MTKKERYRGVIEWFLTNMPVAKTELEYSDPYQLIVAVILSAQCTDKRVNMVTPQLFERYPTPKALASTTPEELFEVISSVTYPNNKSKQLVKMAQMLHHQFDDTLPDSVEELQKLPGVGRKTANVIASIIYDKPVIAVDTHVFRVARRIGLSNGKTPLEVERELTKHIPEELRATSHHWLILHGRYICLARKPKCESCGLVELCRHYQKLSRADLHKGGPR